VHEGQQCRVEGAHCQGTVARPGDLFCSGRDALEGRFQRQVGADIDDDTQQALHLVVPSEQFVDLVVHAPHHGPPT